MKRFSKKLRYAAAGFAVVLLGILLGCCIYVNDYYAAGEAALAAMDSDEQVTVTVREDGSVVFAPEQPERGLIFYPGGKVEHTAYAPLLRELARQDWLCVLVEMPCKLAVLDVHAAEGIPEQFPGIDRWYMGGHSLGGAMAAGYAADHSDDFEGLVLLAAYSTADLSDSGLEVYSIYGTEDLVLDREKYESYRSCLPTDVREHIIEGGCHAGFGDYGAQAGDGEASITAMAQVELTVDFLEPGL